MEVPGQPSLVELWRPTLPLEYQKIKCDKIYVEAPRQLFTLPSPKSGPADVRFPETLALTGR